ncbi:DUF3857 domain-containing protein [Aquimarina sp. D1M17]|uniref:DUF3857 domain-containing protein n=1 Tax=Aquimarina acroporae TaxID=2937283 RepID=UPI0020BFF57F|nr:DUF3857 domain-containing protein [Aquimarina acroporae]MCK8524313.1 DUF3857 domain-containing protein [Aquimarina acroporae]
MRYVKKTRAFVFLFLFVFLSMHSQPRKAEEIKEYIWGKNDTYKEIPQIPEQWKNESAVIVLDQYKHSYSKFTPLFSNSFAGIKVRKHHISRRIVKLNDKAAVDEFSELEFTEAMKRQGIFKAERDKKFLGLRIIKTNGDIKEVDIENEKIKISNSDANQDEYKLAISDLEPGDIVDYYLCTVDSWETNATVFDAIETTLNDEYPTMNFSYNIKLGNDFFINYNSYNGAPELKTLPTENEKEREYLLEAKNIDKRKDSRWVFPLVEYPSFKYQISFARTKKKEKVVNAFLSDSEELVKTKVDADDILKAYEDDYELNLIRKEMKRYFKDKNLSKRELAEEAYYYMRHIFLNRYIESVVAYEEKLNDPIVVYSDPLVITKTRQFLLYFGSFLKNNEIPFEFIKAKRRFDGELEDLLIKENLASLIKVNLETPMYFYPFSSNTLANWVPATIEGTNAYSLKFNNKYNEIETVEKTKLPISDYKDNNTSETSEISFNSDFSTIAIQRTSSLKGHNKVGEMGSRLYFFDYINEEYQKFGTTPYAALLNKKNKKKYDLKFPAYQEKLSQKRIERLEKETEEEYDFDIDDYTYNVVSPGRYSFTEALVFEEQFIIKDDLVKNAGSNFIFEIGKLIGSQVAIEENEKTRSENIYMPYPRSYNNEIRVKIPDGYTVSGYDKLNLKVENATGGFVSTANLNDNQLIVKTHKYYKNNYELNSNWTKMLDFLEVAYQFSQEKILFKKK